MGEWWHDEKNFSHKLEEFYDIIVKKKLVVTFMVKLISQHACVTEKAFLTRTGNTLLMGS